MNRYNIVTTIDDAPQTEVVQWSYNKNPKAILPAGKYYILIDYVFIVANNLFCNQPLFANYEKYDDDPQAPDGSYKSSKNEYLISSEIYRSLVVEDERFENETPTNCGICSASLVEEENLKYAKWYKLIEFTEPALCNLNHPMRITCGDKVVCFEERCEYCDECIETLGS